MYNKIFKTLFFLILPFLLPLSVNGTCIEGEQLYDNRCYPCPGYLKFNPDDRSISCVSCNEGYELIGGECIISATVSPKNIINEKIDGFAIKISSLFKTNNILIGYIILFGLFVGGIYYVYKFATQRR